MLENESLNFLVSYESKNLKLCTHMQVYASLEYSIPLHVPSNPNARSINSKSLAFSLSWLSFSLNGERISLTESGSSSRFFLRKTRDRRIVSSFLWNYWPRFDGKGERGGFIQGRSFNFLQTNTEFFQESCLHRRQPCSENRFEEWFSVDRFDFSTFESFN